MENVRKELRYFTANWNNYIYPWQYLDIRNIKGEWSKRRELYKIDKISAGVWTDIASKIKTPGKELLIQLSAADDRDVIHERDAYGI